MVHRFIGASIQPGSSYQGPYTNRLDIDFSGALDTSTLTPANVRLRYSPDPTFFDSNDAFVADADSTIAWNPMLHRATFQAATALKAGYYLIELNGSTGGIRNTAGLLLDGEFLTNYVAGNTNILSPSRQLSGNGLPGGDYRAAFSIASALDLTLSSANVAENSGTALATITRNDSATGAITVALTSSDVTAVSVPATITIPAGAVSATFVITSINDALADGDQLARITATSDGYISTSADIKVIDDETPTFTVTVSPNSFSENGGAAQLTVSRNTPTALPVVVTLASSNIGAVTLPNTVTIPAGATSATVLVSAVDDTLADGDETVTLTASRPGFTLGSAAVVVVDNETATLLMSLSLASIAEKWWPNGCHIDS